MFKSGVKQFSTGIAEGERQVIEASVKDAVSSAGASGGI